MALGRELVKRSQGRDEKTSKGLLKVMKALGGGLGTQGEEEGQMLGMSENARGERTNTSSLSILYVAYLGTVRNPSEYRQ